MNDEDEDDGEQHQTASSSSTLVDWSNNGDEHNDVVQPSWLMPTPLNEVRDGQRVLPMYIQYDIILNSVLFSYIAVLSLRGIHHRNNIHHHLHPPPPPPKDWGMV